MATAMHLCGVRTHPAFPRRQRLTLWNRPGSLVSGLCSRTVENPRGCRVLIVSYKIRSDDGLEWSKPLNQLTSVMDFGASSVLSAERMREVVDIIRSFREERPVIVLSAMGETTSKLLLAGENAVVGSTSNVSDIEEWSFVMELHLRTADELGVDRSTVSTHLEDLMRLLKVIAQVKELTLRTKAYLVSFGECMSTRIFAAYLNKVGIKARQYDAFDIGFITTDDFTNADILEATYPAVAKRLHSDWVNDSAIPVVTGSLGKGLRSGAITTLGWGASASTATTIAKALGLREIKVLPPQSMGPAREGDIPLRVKNSYNTKAPGTLITRAQDMTKAVLSGTVFKSMVIVLYILSKAIVDQIDKHPSNLWSRGLIYQLARGSFVVLAVIVARDMFKKVQSNKALMKLAVMLYFVSSFVLGQLREDKSDVIELAKRLYNASWCIKYASLLLLIVSLSVNSYMSSVISWIPTLNDGSTKASLGHKPTSQGQPWAQAHKAVALDPNSHVKNNN